MTKPIILEAGVVKPVVPQTEGASPTAPAEPPKVLEAEVLKPVVVEAEEEG